MDKSKQNYYLYLLLIIVFTVLTVGTGLYMIELYSSGELMNMIITIPLLILFAYLLHASNQKAKEWYPWKKTGK
ncbi:hypothetical protein [Gracilimonas mengyeensis]|uniref:Uncharacterized protein n=1 Tax=Gracilimonas mengyeensis TaxID=1302730 RepID=A0A521EK59_9BACT|nr:hypothetical protein [Gracilimonas mengyeensis]SMO84296.1 hypothetical protein SAMN06265219_11299 [Gracilimonas mengyeensis]